MKKLKVVTYMIISSFIGVLSLIAFVLIKINLGNTFVSSKSNKPLAACIAAVTVITISIFIYIGYNIFNKNKKIIFWAIITIIISAMMILPMYTIIGLIFRVFSGNITF